MVQPVRVRVHVVLVAQAAPYVEEMGQIVDVTQSLTVLVLHCVVVDDDWKEWALGCAVGVCFEEVVWLGSFLGDGGSGSWTVGNLYISQPWIISLYQCELTCHLL
jgi:hypothetical protein